MSSKVRSLFLKKQVYYVLTFILMWACFLANAIVSIILKYKKDKGQ
jgi:predicted permease